MLVLVYLFVFLTFVSLVALLLLLPLALFKKVKMKVPFIAFGSLIVCFAMTGVIANLGLKHNRANESEKNSSIKLGNYTLYKTKVVKITDNGNGNWKISGKTNAPDGSKIIVTVPDENNENYGEISAESTKLAEWAKAKNKKFAVIVDNVGIVNAKSPKAGSKTKVLVFAIKNYDEPWDKSDISSKIVKKASKFGAINLTITKKQSKYLAGIASGLESSSSSSKNNSSSSNYSNDDSDSSNFSSASSDSSYSKSVDNVVKFESELNEAIIGSKGTISDIKYSANDDGSAINSVTIVASDVIELANPSDQQKVADSALNTVIELSSANNINTPSVSIVSESGTQIATSNSDKTAMTLSSN
jgi:hypothetical protein